MAKWQPASPAALAAFSDMTRDLAHIEPRTMFGYSCVFANGYLCIGTHEVGIVVRLPEADRSAFVQQYAAQIFEPMVGRPMREYVVVPVDLYAKRVVLKKWARKSVDYVCSLPAKQAKAAKTKAVAGVAASGSVAGASARRPRS